jgi:predicted chitinase
MRAAGIPSFPNRPRPFDEIHFTCDWFAEASKAVLAAVPEEMKSYAETAVPLLLQSCRDLNINAPNQVAYILATTEHESRFGMPNPHIPGSESLLEDHNEYTPHKTNGKLDGRWSAKNHITKRPTISKTPIGMDNLLIKEEMDIAYWDEAYGARTDLGNRPKTHDGSDYRGRGYIQLTGRTQYKRMSALLNDSSFSYTFGGTTYGGKLAHDPQKKNQPIDLEANPTHVNLVPALAARVEVLYFRDHKIDNYIDSDPNGKKKDFVNARHIVNGDKNGPAIAEKANRYAKVLAAIWPHVMHPERNLGDLSGSLR